MTKSFRQLIVENEKEYCYIIKSTEDILCAERLALIKLAATPHQCFKVEADHKIPAERFNKDFPKYPNSPTYTVRVYIGLPCNPSVLEQEIKTRLNFRTGDLKVEQEGAKKEAEHDDAYMTTPGNTSGSDTFRHDVDGDPQKLVGMGRLGDFIKEIEKDRAEAIEYTEEREIYESFVVPYEGLAKILGESVRPGFYYVERSQNDLQIDGPFNVCPYGFKFQHNVFETDISTRLNRSFKVDGRDRYEVVIEG
jgi:hypothetical protein